MDGGEFVQVLDEILFTLLFVATVWQAARHRTRPSIETAALFGAVCGLFLIAPITTLLGLTGTIAPGVIAVALLGSIPYLLARLTESFSDPPPWAPWLAAGLAVALVGMTLLTGPQLPQWLLLAAITWFTVAGAYTGIAFLREATRSRGLTRRRMEAVAVGSMLLMAAIVVALSGAIVGIAADTAAVIARLLALGSGVSFWVGFAPPLALRRWWQAPEVRAFLERASAVPRIASEREALAVLQDGAAQALGAPHAVIGLHDEEAGTLSYVSSDGSDFVTGTDEYIGGRAFTARTAIFIEDAVSEDPSNAATYRRTGASAVLAAPITAGDTRIGVLCIYSSRAPIFADDDLRLVTMLASQAAVVLESRRFSEEAASVRALEAATRLKDDFLSAAAHDLKTPLTVLLGQAELLERFATRDPNAPTDIERVRRIAGEARRLQRLVEELLDTSRIQDGQLVTDLETADLATLARETCDRHQTEGVNLALQADAPVPATVDRTRIVQLLDNLIGNARKYSAAGTPITVSVWLEGDEARLAVRDAGIGIAPEDLPRLFERFYRGSNVGDRRHDGMGLGLYICRGIAEQHGGRIWAEPIPDRGTVFHVALPAAGANVAASEPASPEPVPEAGADASPAITPATSAP
jgi:signal transduction histidine kinase